VTGGFADMPTNTRINANTTMKCILTLGGPHKTTSAEAIVFEKSRQVTPRNASKFPNAC